MNNFWESFTGNFIIELLIALLLSGAGSLVIDKIHKILTEKDSGIYRIHKRGCNVKNMERSINEARTIKQIAFMPLFFIRENENRLAERFKDGCSIQLLFCSPESALLKELSSMERGNDRDIPNDLPQITNFLKKIMNDAGNESRGSVEVRLYNTEIRNPATICEMQNKKKRAYVTISVPPKKSTEMPLIEFRGENCDTVEKYFDLVWKRHEEDVWLKIEKNRIIVDKSNIEETQMVGM